MGGREGREGRGAAAVSLARAAGGEKPTVRKEFVKAAWGGRERGEGRGPRGEGRDRSVGGRQNGFFPPDKSRSRPPLTHVTSFLQDAGREGKRRGRLARPLPATGCRAPSQDETPPFPRGPPDPGGWILFCYLPQSSPSPQNMGSPH